jgi:monofunctional biosynthetic peptidoglycan transglycosylase
MLLGLMAFSVHQVLLLRFINPPFTPLMVYCWIKGDGMDFQWRSLSEVSSFLQQAVLASEDQRFLEHSGFDWNQIQRAIQERQRRGRVRGASTISMQVARNLYLWQGHSWIRKGLEAYYTVLIEIMWPKWRIMEIYLNVVEWGPGIFGAEASAQHYFQRPASRLTKYQAALMAAVLPNPKRWKASQPTPYIRSRQSTILRQMHMFAPIRKTSGKP